MLRPRIAPAVINPTRKPRFDRRITILCILADRDRHPLILSENQIDASFARKIAHACRAVILAVTPEPCPELIACFGLIDSAGAERIRDLPDFAEHPIIRNSGGVKAVRPDFRRDAPRDLPRSHPRCFALTALDKIICFVECHCVIPRARPS